MLKLALVLAIVVAQAGCYYEAGDRYKPSELTSAARERLEADKREYLTIEDLKIGSGTLASWNREVFVDIEVRYANGEVIYKGPAFAVMGFYGLPETGISDKRHIGSNQIGIRLGLNGMAVGGRRRFTVDRNLVCTDLPASVDSRAHCNLVGYGIQSPIKKENLIVEATLKEACIPVKLETNIWYIGVNMDVWCRKEETPRLDPTLPIWHFY